MTKLKFIILILCGFSQWGYSAPEARPDFNWGATANWAIQERGRLKPLDTFATETVWFVTGKKSWKDKDGNAMGPMEVLWGWVFRFDLDWEEEPFIRVDYKPLKEILKVPTENQYLSPKAVRENQELPKFLREVAAKERRREKLNELEKKAVQLQNQRLLLDAILTGEAMTFLPNPKGIGEPWFSITALTQAGTLPYPAEVTSKFSAQIKTMMEAFMAKEAAAFNLTIKDLTEMLKRDLAKGNYPTESSLDREVHYNHLHPFRWAWILYTVAFVLLVINIFTLSGWSKKGGMGFLFLGFTLHAYGFVLRCLIAGRPPVTNMFESVIWVTWGCVLFSIFIWLAYKKSTIPAAATVFAIAGLVLADNLPSVLDPSINPLEPVLRSNYWLTIHVLTITMSYAAFALSNCLGNVVLGNYLFRPSQTDILQQYSLYMYRAIQIGVVLLAAGTILGGIWADYSWGRFWGWDPKEVWALIALLLYIAVLHGRFTGWLRGFGFATAAVLSFMGVLMAWYGVNFVLGVGLHAYGFGTGGLGYVLFYIAVQLGFILVAYSQYSKFGVKNSPIFPTKK